MIIRELKKEEIELLREIDRREVIEEVYYLRDGKLETEKEFYDVSEFPCIEFEDYIVRLKKDYDSGGVVVGAFKEDKIAGMIAIQNRLRGTQKDTILMDILYVSREYRKYGVGKMLVNYIKKKSKSMGAKRLYVSATPSKNTVDFYLGQGCVLAEDVDAELFEKEPLDIHLHLEL